MAGSLERKDLAGKTVTIKARLADFTTFTRQTTLGESTSEAEAIRVAAWHLMVPELTPGRSFRLLGVGVSKFNTPEREAPYQLPLPEA